MIRTTKIALFVCWIVIGTTACLAQTQDVCGARHLRVQRISDFERAAIRKVMPDYPSDAKQRGIAGTVQLKLLIGKSGHVRAVCPVISRGATKPDGSLIAAARKAALQWEFPPDFGLQGNLNINFDYVELFIAFNFDLSKPPSMKESKEHATSGLLSPTRALWSAGRSIAELPWGAGLPSVWKSRYDQRGGGVALGCVR
jgi:TonB family protein